MQKFMLLLIGVLLVITSGVSAQDNSVTLIVTRDPVSLDPQGNVDPGAPVILMYLYDTLVYQAPDGTIIPNAAESWAVSEDGLTLTFDLIEGITFSNGEPLNAAAVVYTFERLRDEGERSLISGEVSNIAEVAALDDLTVQMTLNEPSSSLLAALTYPYAGILEPGATEAAGADYGLNPVGSGPFMLQEWVQDDRITFVPNPAYSGHRSWVASGSPANVALDIRFVVDESTRANALLAEEVDMAYLVSGAQIARFDGMPGYTVLDSPARSLTYLGINTTREPLNDPAVRRAIAQAINREDITLIATDGIAQPFDELLPPTIYPLAGEVGYAPAYDPDAARQALADAGYAEGLQLEILTSTFPTFGNIATVLQGQLSEIGIDVSIEVLDFSAIREIAAAGGYDLLVTRYDWNDPDILDLYLNSENIGRTNRWFYENEAVNDLLVQGRATYDQAERAEIYAELQRIVAESLPMVPLYVPVTKVVVRDRVQNVDLIHTHIVLDTATVN